MNFSIGGVVAAATTQAGPETLKHTRLVRAAQEFEASLMQEMLKPMRTKDPLTTDSNATGSDDQEDGGVLQSFGTQAMAEAMAKGGGMGIAKQVVRQVERQTMAPQATGPQTVGPRK